jgi:ankyrin repeat protein
MRISIHQWLSAASICLAANGAWAGVYEDTLIAARNDDSAKVIQFLQRGVDINTADEHGTTLLMYAARNGNESLLDHLLNNDAKPLIKNKYGDDALMFAALQGHAGCVAKLLAAGVKPDTEIPAWTPLIYAAFSGHGTIAKYLLDKGARVDARTPNGLTALMVAARNNRLDIVRLLLDHKADPKLKNSAEDTALDIALKAGNSGIAELLGAAMDPP